MVRKWVSGHYNNKMIRGKNVRVWVPGYYKGRSRNKEAIKSKKIDWVGYSYLIIISLLVSFTFSYIMKDEIIAIVGRTMTTLILVFVMLRLKLVKI